MRFNTPALCPLPLSLCLSHLDLDRPAEVGDVHVEGDVVVAAEVELLTGEAVAVLLNVASEDDGHLLTGDGAGWPGTRGKGRE